MANIPTEPWLKLRKSLLRSPKIHQLAAHLGTSLGEAFYLACLWFDYLDAYSDNGVTNVTPPFLETYFSQPNFYTAFAQIGWIDCTETGCVFAPDYEKHNGQNAKRRLQDAERKAKSRAAKVTPKSRKSHTNVTEESQKSHDRERERERIYNIRESIENNPQLYQRDPQKAPTPIFNSSEERSAYRRWLRAVKDAHPGGRNLERLGDHTKAIEAFRACPSAADHGELLRAYHDSPIITSTSGRPFLKKTQFRWYLADLSDILADAFQWAKETRWKPRNSTPSKHGTFLSRRSSVGAETEVPTPPTPPEETITEDDKTAFFSDLKTK